MRVSVLFMKFGDTDVRVHIAYGSLLCAYDHCSIVTMMNMIMINIVLTKTKSIFRINISVITDPFVWTTCIFLTSLLLYRFVNYEIYCDYYHPLSTFVNLTLAAAELCRQKVGKAVFNLYCI
jgi:hypothetical protein